MNDYRWSRADNSSLGSGRHFGKDLRMADPVLVGWLALTDRLVRWLPIVGVVNLVIAWAAFLTGFADFPLLAGIAIATIAASLPVFLRLFFGRAMRSLGQLGFSSIVGAWWYAQWFRGYPRMPLIILFASFASLVLISRHEARSSGVDFLLFSTGWSVGIVCHFLRKWPSDLADTDL